MMEQNYKIKTEVFEGPLDLLLGLIEKRKLFINDVSLSQIADDYISYIKNSGELSVKNSSDFVLIASTLMLIKSKSLLPTLNLTIEEEQSIDDLEERLKVYKRIKDLGKHISKRFGKQIIFSKSYSVSYEPVFSPDKRINRKDIFSSIKEVLRNIPVKEITPKAMVKKVISLEEVVDDLTKRIKLNIKMSFSDFSSKGKGEKIDIVVSFLAMLELVKQGVVSVKQNSNFGDIDIENTDVSTPVY